MHRRIVHTALCSVHVSMSVPSLYTCVLSAAAAKPARSSLPSARTISSSGDLSGSPILQKVDHSRYNWCWMMADLVALVSTARAM